MTASVWPSVVIGLVSGGINFYLLARVVRTLIGQAAADPAGPEFPSHGRRVSRWRITLLVTLKIALVAAIIVLIVSKAYVRPLALLGGFTLSLVGGILCMTLRGSVSSPTE